MLIYVQNQYVALLVACYVDTRVAGVTIVLLCVVQHLSCAIIVAQLGILRANAPSAASNHHRLPAPTRTQIRLLLVPRVLMVMKGRQKTEVRGGYVN